MGPYPSPIYEAFPLPRSKRVRVPPKTQPRGFSQRKRDRQRPPCLARVITLSWIGNIG
ncbi:hypothetical protein NC653_011924 [Populus alba x Populus x berolinensis]|uniref:Uncharacterized protein n=1 Tax=Populus alba x Populus x berolinensis TaxID=444605 RepID=A0AAD6R4L4_9ROSI|nr:hypothetical protein NC653_011924 [Populus alba x Populus x berolinensis]